MTEILERPCKSQGTFILPALSPAIPVKYGTDDYLQKAVARLALALERAGIPLPGGAFESIGNTVKLQLGNWVCELLGAHASCIGGHVSFEVRQERLEFWMNATNNLNAYRLKPVVEALEKLHPGAGWFVEGLIDDARGYGIPLYNPAFLGYQMDYMFHEQTTDEDYCKEMRSQETGEDPEDIELTEEDIQSYRESVPYMPSNVYASIEDHRHLLRMASPHQESKRYPKLSVRQATKLLGQDMPEKLRTCLQDAINLAKVQASISPGTYAWNAQEDYEDLIPIGAACFVTWDTIDLLAETVEHFEEGEYNSGQAIEVLAITGIKPESTDQEYDAFVRSIRVYLQHWNALSALLSHFPVIEG